MFQIAEVLKKVPFFQTLGRDGIDFIVERRSESRCKCR